MKEEMLLRRMLRYIVIVSLVRAQRYVVPTLTIYLCSCDDAEEQKGCLVALVLAYSSVFVRYGRYYNSALRTLD